MDFELAQLALIFAPGLIWANIDEKYGAGKPPNTVKFFVRSFLFGLTTYAVLYLTYYLLGCRDKGPSILIQFVRRSVSTNRLIN